MNFFLPPYYRFNATYTHFLSQLLQAFILPFIHPMSTYLITSIMSEYRLIVKEIGMLKEGKWPQWLRKVKGVLRSHGIWSYIK
jgi:hypothetical protein